MNDLDLWLESGPGGPNDSVGGEPCAACGYLAEWGELAMFAGEPLCGWCYQTALDSENELLEARCHEQLDQDLWT